MSKMASSNSMRYCLVAALLGPFALQVVLTSRQTSVASDEVVILPAGYLFLKTALWYLLPEHPPLIPALSALPLLAVHPRLDVNDPTLTQERSNPWNVGLSFLALNNDDGRLFFWGSLPRRFF